MQIIDHQEKGYRDLAMDTIAWVTFANRPLTVLQLQHALATKIRDSKIDTENITREKAILSICAGLITLQHVEMRSPAFSYRGTSYSTVHLVHENSAEVLRKVVVALGRDNTYKDCSSVFNIRILSRVWVWFMPIR